jgi:hypothetical protein
MDGRVIPMPHARGLRWASSTTEEFSEQVAVLSVELRPVDDAAPELPAEVVERIHERCIRAALVVAGRRGGRLFLAGTSTHPVVDARFRGDGAAARASKAAVEIALAVADSQRSDESHLAVCMGIGVGEASMSPVGVRITRGSPAMVAEVLRADCVPGSVAIGGQGADETARELGAATDEGIEVEPGPTVVPVWRLDIDRLRKRPAH